MRDKDQHIPIRPLHNDLRRSGAPGQRIFAQDLHGLRTCPQSLTHAGGVVPRGAGGWRGLRGFSFYQFRRCARRCPCRSVVLSLWITGQPRLNLGPTSAVVECRKYTLRGFALLAYVGVCGAVLGF